MKKFITMRIMFFGLCLLQCLMLAGQQRYSAEEYQNNPRLALENARQLESQGQMEQAIKFYNMYSALTGEDTSEDISRLEENLLRGKQLIVNGRKAVDLGLSVKWATCNVGASSPEQYGGYFAWGETNAKEYYNSANSTTYGRSMGNLCNTDYDVARATWGGTWRLPSRAEMQELVDLCQWTWASQDGHNGYKVTGPNGNSIFLPAAGSCLGPILLGSDGYYWSGTPCENDSIYAYSLHFFHSGPWVVNCSNRSGGNSVRPVTE